MARSFSNAKIFSAFVADGISNAIYRRGYAAAAASSQGALSSAARGSGPKSVPAMKKKSGEATAEKVSWVPDPVTGFYRPENIADELDVADLRAIFLKKH